MVSLRLEQGCHHGLIKPTGKHQGRNSQDARDCVVELVGLEPTTRVLWNVGVSDQLTLSNTGARARRVPLLMGISTKVEISRARDCVVELVGLEPTTRGLWNAGVSDQLTLSDTWHSSSAGICTASERGSGASGSSIFLLEASRASTACSL